MDDVVPAATYQPYLPRSRKRTKAGRYSHEITYEELAQHFHLPTEKACQQLGVGLTILKRICRRFKLARWPYKKPSKSSPTPRDYGNHHGARHEATTPATTTTARVPTTKNRVDPSPFATASAPTSLAWETYCFDARSRAPAAEGCSRPLPRRVAFGEPASFSDSILRDLGVSTSFLPPVKTHQSPLDMLFSAIAQSESEDGGRGSGGGDAKMMTMAAGAHGHQQQPSSPVSVNLHGGMGTDTTTTTTTATTTGVMAVPGDVSTTPVPASTCGFVPVGGTAPSASPSVSTNTAVLAQYATTATAATKCDAENSPAAAAASVLGEVLASNPNLTEQMAHLLSAYTNNAATAAVFKQPLQLHHILPQQHQQQSSFSLLSDTVAKAHRQGLLAPSPPIDDAAATILRRTEQSAKYEAFQAKMVAHQAGLQRFQMQHTLPNQYSLNGASLNAAAVGLHPTPSMMTQQNDSRREAWLRFFATQMKT